MLEKYERQCNLLSTIQSTVESSYINSSFSSPNAMNDNDESANPSLSQEDRARSTIERPHNYGSEDQFKIPLNDIGKQNCQIGSFLPLMMMILLQHFAIATTNLSILMSLATVNLILLLMTLDTTLLVVVLQANIV
jgi:hypothetical protein